MNAELRLLLSQGKTDSEKLLSAIEKLPHDNNEIPADIIEQLVELVPQIAELLDLHNQLLEFAQHHADLVPQIDELAGGELAYQYLCIQSKILYLFAHLGARARAAIPTLIAQTDTYSQRDLSIWAMGKIGGPGVLQRLIEWTYWGPQFGGGHEWLDAIEGAIRNLGEPGIEELLEMASPTNECVYQRTTALLNLVDNTNYPVEQSIRLIALELDHIAGANTYPKCRELLRNDLIWLGHENAETVVAAIQPLLLAKSPAADDFIGILSELGDVACPLLTQAVDENIHELAAISALAKIGGEGLVYVYSFITRSMNRLLVGRAIRSIPIDTELSFEVLRHAIEVWRVEWKHWGLIRRLAVRRLGEFSDYQLEITVFFKSLHDDPDPSLATLADETLTQIMDKMDH